MTVLWFDVRCFFHAYENHDHLRSDMNKTYYKDTAWDIKKWYSGVISFFPPKQTEKSKYLSMFHYYVNDVGVYLVA